jgi:leucyl/phenylalanyl-tRNA--protein transferase
MHKEPIGPSMWDFDPSSWPDDDCVAVGADLEPSTLLEAYRKGAFPMPHDGELLWWSPMERGVLVPERVRVTKSLRQSCRKYTVTVNESFEQVIDACADPQREGAWIDPDIRAAYIQMNRLGWAHSIETRDGDGRLVGGLYGLAIGSVFAGESMFHHARDASKVALVWLAKLMGKHGLIDAQWNTAHLASLGFESWSRNQYLDAIGPLMETPGPSIWV